MRLFEAATVVVIVTQLSASGSTVGTDQLRGVSFGSILKCHEFVAQKEALQRNLLKAIPSASRQAWECKEITK